MFNALTEESVRVDNSLFTTLSTTTRVVEFSNRKFLLTDTVGFIDRLPLTLIEAFHSTLEETIFSDLIILVLDLSEPIEIIESKNKVCNETINRLGASGIPVITALNKIDLISEQEKEEKLKILEGKTKNPILLSAKRQTNLKSLRHEILSMLENYIHSSFSAPLTSQIMPFISWVHKVAEVKSESFNNDSVQVVFEATPQYTEQIRRKVEQLNGKFQSNHTSK